jgi:hypothetical protein
MNERGTDSGRRVGLIAAAVVVAAAVGMGAAYAGGAFKTDDAMPTSAGSAPVSTPTPGPTPTAGATSSTVTAVQSQPSTMGGASSSTVASSKSSAASASLVAPTAAERAVGTFYGFADAALMQSAVPPSQAAVDAIFSSRAVEVKYWNINTRKAQPAAMCGAKGPNLAIVATSPNGVTVSFYEKGRLSATQAEVTLDHGSQKIASISCADSVPPAFTGTQKVVQYYSVDLYRQTTPKFPGPGKTYAPAAADGPQEWLNFDTNVCAQYRPASWVFYAPVSTTSGDAWRFAYDGAMDRSTEVLFTDPSTGAMERTLCGGFPDIPAPDKAAAGKADPDPATLLVSWIYDAYIYERAQQSLGAIPTDEIAPYFASHDAFVAASKSTGAIPFLCASKAPNVVTAIGSTVVADTEILTYTAGYASDPTPGNTPAPVGKFTVSVDLSTMKIKALTCT